MNFDGKRPESVDFIKERGAYYFCQGVSVAVYPSDTGQGQSVVEFLKALKVSKRRFSGSIHDPEIGRETVTGRIPGKGPPRAPSESGITSR